MSYQSNISFLANSGFEEKPTGRWAREFLSATSHDDAFNRAMDFIHSHLSSKFSFQQIKGPYVVEKNARYVAKVVVLLE